MGITSLSNKIHWYYKAKEVIAILRSCGKKDDGMRSAIEQTNKAVIQKINKAIFSFEKVKVRRIDMGGSTSR